MSGQVHPHVKWALRVFGLINFLNGVGFIIYAVVLEEPPETALTIGLVILGSIGMILALLGAMIAYCNKCFNSLFLIVGSLVTIADLGIVISMFVNEDTQVTNICQAQYPDMSISDGTDVCPDQNSLEQAIEIGRIYFLIAVIFQIISLIMAFILRWKNPQDNDYEDFEGAVQSKNSAQAVIQMEALRNSITRGGKVETPEVGGRRTPEGIYNSGNKSQKSLEKKMSSKYGAYGYEGKPSIWKRLF